MLCFGSALPARLLSGLSALASVILLSGQARADTTSLLIQVRPPGSVIEFSGPQSTVSRSPNAIPRPPAGWYRLQASHPGYESWSDDVYIDAFAPEGITVALARKTRAKAGLRALVFPGWGHYYAGRKSRGALITALALAAAGGYLYLDNRADNKVSEFQTLRALFEDAASVDEQERLEPLVQAAQQDAFNAETDKRNWGWAALGFYGYQILDAVLFFPESPQIGLQGIELGLRPDGSGSFVLGAHYEF